jgi:hypothetical protein
MNDPELDRADAIHQIAVILASAYLRLRFPAPASPQLDSSETESVHVTAG